MHVRVTALHWCIDGVPLMQLLMRCWCVVDALALVVVVQVLTAAAPG